MKVCIVNRLESFQFLDTIFPVRIQYTYVRKGCDSACFLYMILSLWFCPTRQLSSSYYIQIDSRTHPPSCASDNWVQKEGRRGECSVAAVNKVGEITTCPKYGPPARSKSLLGMRQMHLRRRVAVSTSTNTPPHRTTSAHSIPGSRQYLVSQYAQNCIVHALTAETAVLTSASDIGQLHVPAALPPGRNLHPLNGRCWAVACQDVMDKSQFLLNSYRKWSHASAADCRRVCTASHVCRTADRLQEFFSRNVKLMVA